MSISGRAEDVLPEWQRSWNGVFWHQMPGDDADHQKLNFALWKRGLKEYEIDEETAVIREICPSFGRIASIAPVVSVKRAEEAERRDAAALEREARMVRIERLKVRMLELMERGVSGRQLADAAGLVPQYVSKVRCGQKVMGGEKLEALEKAVAEAEVRPPRKREPEVPAGCIPFKEWLMAEAERQGLTGPALYERMRRGAFPRPVVIALNKRRHFVRVAEVPAVA